MEGEIAGTSQSKVLTNTSSLLLIALLFPVLASALKPGGWGGGEERWRFSSGKALLCLNSTAAEVAGLRPVGSPGGPRGPCSAAMRRWWKESAEMGCPHADEFAVRRRRPAHSAPRCWLERSLVPWTGAGPTPRKATWWPLPSSPGHSAPVLWTAAQSVTSGAQIWTWERSLVS